MTSVVGVRNVYVGLQRAEKRGNVHVFGLQRDRERMFVRGDFTVSVLYLFVNAHGDTPDPLWQGMCYGIEESC